jgi:hypothetical protein
LSTSFVKDFNTFTNDLNFKIKFMFFWCAFFNVLIHCLTTMCLCVHSNMMICYDLGRHILVLKIDGDVFNKVLKLFVNAWNPNFNLSFAHNLDPKFPMKK